MINVTKTYLPDKSKYKEYVDQIFESGWITNQGDLVKKLKNRLESYLGVKNILLVTNGTLALQVAYKLLGLTGEVITTPFSFVATTSSLVWEGLQPIFVDIDSQTLCIDYKQIKDKITSRTSAIVPVHVFGNCCEVEEIERIARKNDLKIVYDAAHTFGIDYKNESILNYGDISILSFHATKIFHTIEGGALIINDDELYKRAERMINFGIIRQENIEGLGINAKMNEFQAAMGLAVLDDMDDIIHKRKGIYEYYLDKLSNKLRFPKYNVDSTKNYSYFPIIFESEEILSNIKQKLENENIFPRRYFYPSLDTLDYISNDKNMNISNEISRRILCLPIYHTLKRPEQDQIIRIIKKGI
ncbi:DegT/DnrJ/EryC1/StrS family aminotransferase [Orenia marismortui]|uniref:dTDP-4-amino-4,6-dideoxygalactose transaminase n=1 Tax=Orenia marismortui TaxID=46469 RepID=A0A4R8HFX4_9FIRM|nr:DegT/DnrJ/EryC1/StrS family aminotransferase [Orenia marismortui]TDX58922.1 dTDP-4-amino-4,6-dideoxygalactose transaminase [Orenia marismortui]